MLDNRSHKTHTGRRGGGRRRGVLHDSEIVTVPFVEPAGELRHSQDRRTRRPNELRLPKFYRDLWGRRIWREWRYRAVSVAGVLSGDAICAMGAASGASAVITGVSASVSLMVMGVLLGQALMGTYRTGAIGHAKERILVGVGVGVFASALGPVTIASATQLKTALVFGALLLPLITLWRYAAGKLVRLAQRMGVGRKRTLIVGTDEAAWRMINHFRRRDESGLNIIGHLCDAGDSSPAAIGATDELPAMIERHDIEHVLVADGVEPDVYKRIASESLLRGATVGVISGLFDEEVARTSFRGVAGWPALQLRMSGAEMLQVAAKRSFDIVASSVILILASPVMAAVALAIRLDSRGPILFSQRRPGLGGRDFRMYKFRSMRCDAEAILAADPELTRAFLENGCKFPNGKDPRISRVGGFLRSSSLDELPQLFNVLLGDMSLVGPRPVLGPEFEQFGDLVSVILSVKPGMTGLWQVSGRSTVAGKDRAALDAQYVAGWSLALDARILARTIPVVWKGVGAR